MALSRWLMESLQPILRLPDLAWKDKIDYLAWRMRLDGGKGPEATPVRHLFLPGRYIREMDLPAGHLFIGRVHRKGHIMLLCEGVVHLITEHSFTVYTGPDAVMSTPGYQTVCQIIRSSRVRTIHPNPGEERDTEKLEREIFEPVEPALERGKILADRIDYQCALLEAGLTQERVKEIFLHERDLVPMPEEYYHIYRGRSDIEGTGIFTFLDVEPDFVFGPMRLQGKRTIVGRFTNHSISPNCRAVRHREDLYLRAKQKIKAYEELTVNYRQVQEVA